jgi:hypothetical protein
MITIVNKGRDEAIVIMRGLSTDTKPTNVPNGSEFLEMDTGFVCYFDADGIAWVGGGSDSGGGGR